MKTTPCTGMFGNSRAELCAEKVIDFMLEWKTKNGNTYWNGNALILGRTVYTSYDSKTGDCSNKRDWGDAVFTRDRGTYEKDVMRSLCPGGTVFALHLNENTLSRIIRGEFANTAKLQQFKKEFYNIVSRYGFHIISRVFDGDDHWMFFLDGAMENVVVESDEEFAMPDEDTEQSFDFVEEEDFTYDETSD